MASKPVKDVKTFDGNLHEVDIRHKDKSYTAWAFVDSKLIESRKASTQEKAVVSWKKEYQAALGEAPAPKKVRPKKEKEQVPEEAHEQVEAQEQEVPASSLPVSSLPGPGGE